MKKTKYLFYISQNYSFAILRPVQEAIHERNGEVAWFLTGNEINAKYLSDSERRLHSVEDIVDYAPDAILHPANTAPTFLPGINVAVFHGFDAGKLDRKGNNDHFKIRNCFDLYCTQGPNSTHEFQKHKKTPSHFEVIETGWCALDPLFDQASAAPQGAKPTVLMCSTFSRKLSCAPHLIDTVSRLSQTGKWQWLVQFHPKMSKEVVEQYKGIQNDHLRFIETDNVIPLLQQADVMVCDTSSVMLMHVLQNKPVVTFRNVSPQNYMIDVSEPSLLEDAIDRALERPEWLMKNIQQFIADTHPYDDGKSSQRLLEAIDQVISGQFDLVKKPLDIFRQFKMRKSLNYWKL